MLIFCYYISLQHFKICYQTFYEVNKLTSSFFFFWQQIIVYKLNVTIVTKNKLEK